MMDIDVLSDEFMHLIERACSEARSAALAAGHPVVYCDTDGRYVAEYPGGRRFEIRFDPTQTRDSHIVVVRELTSHAA